MYVLLVTDEGMEDLESTMSDNGHTVVRYSISSDMPPEVEGMFGDWVGAITHADLVILDDRLHKKYSDVLRRFNGSAVSLSQVVSNLIGAGLKPESILQKKIIKRRWWSRNGH